jgi:hypothetical protein
VYLAIFTLLISGGVIVKRVYEHPEFMTFFHLPAAVFLVLAGYRLSKAARAKYRETSDLWRKEL